MKKNNIIKHLVVFAFTIGLLFTNASSIHAIENNQITIYNSTMAEIMETYEPEAFASLPKDIQEYYESVPAENILGEDAPEYVEIPSKVETRAGVIWAPDAIVLTSARFDRTSNSKITYGGTYSCTKPVKMICSAFLINNDTGVIKFSKSKEVNTPGISNSISESKSLTKSSTKYYGRAVGTYIDENNIYKTTSNKTITKN